VESLAQALANSNHDEAPASVSLTGHAEGTQSTFSCMVRVMETRGCAFNIDRMRPGPNYHAIRFVDNPLSTNSNHDEAICMNSRASSGFLSPPRPAALLRFLSTHSLSPGRPLSLVLGSATCTLLHPTLAKKHIERRAQNHVERQVQKCIEERAQKCIERRASSEILRGELRNRFSFLITRRP